MSRHPVDGGDGGGAIPPPSGTTWAATDRWLGALTAGGSAIGTVWIVALMVLINADVIGRVALNRPIAGTPELVSLSIVGIVFLQLPDAARRRSLTRSESLMDFVLRRRPRVGRVIGGLYELVGAVLFGILAWTTYPQAVKAWIRSEFIGNPGLLTVPTWALLGLIVLGATLLAVQFLAIGCREIVGALRPAGGVHGP